MSAIGKEDLQSTFIDEDNTETATQEFLAMLPKICIKKEDIQDDRSKAAHELQSYCALPMIKRKVVIIIHSFLGVLLNNNKITIHVY